MHGCAASELCKKQRCHSDRYRVPPAMDRQSRGLPRQSQGRNCDAHERSQPKLDVLPRVRTQRSDVQESTIRRRPQHGIGNQERAERHDSAAGALRQLDASSRGDGMNGEPKKASGTIDLEPTWESLCRIADRGALKAGELMPACRIADTVRQAQKAGKTSITFDL